MCTVALRVGVGVESCTVEFLGARHFLFTSSDTFAVGCIVQPQHTAKTEPPKFPRRNSHEQRSYVTMAIGYSRRGTFGGSVL